MPKHNPDWTQEESVLDVFAAMYKNSIKEFIKLSEGKVVVFDCDGTLTEFRYGRNHLLPCKNSELNEYILKDNFYTRAKFSITMKYVIDILFKENSNNFYVVTTSVPNVMPLKSQRLIQAFPQLQETHIYHTLANTDKVKVLQEIYDKHQTEIILVEDNADILIDADDNLPFVTSYHVSCLLP